MRENVPLILTASSLVAVVVLAVTLPQGWQWIILSVALIGLVSLYFHYLGIVLPQKAVRRGMDLIKSQDFNNRLTKVGEKKGDAIVGLFNEMIDKLRAERLHNLEQEGFLRLLTEASPMGVMTLDLDGKVYMVNESFCRLTGLRKEEIPRGTQTEDIDNELLGTLGKLEEGKTAVVRLSDTRIYRCYHLSFIQRGFRRRFYLIESLTEEIIRAERAAYEKVIRTISHEVNNTMGGVRTVLDIVANESTDGEIREVIESCARRSEEMCRFISRFAEVVKVPEPHLVPCDLKKETEALMPFLEKLAGEDIGISLKAGDDLDDVMLDSMLFQQVMVNIVKNSCESIEKNGLIEISINRGENAIILEISDNGPGISEEAARHLFSPFYSTKKEGKGIGLTLAAEILHKHKARYSLRTYSDGITRFTIELPL